MDGYKIETVVKKKADSFKWMYQHKIADENLQNTKFL